MERKGNMGGEQASLAVIGGGFSGTMVALHLARRLPPGRRVLLCERAPGFGRGTAYATGRAEHILNVRAANMSAFADDPGHFARWAEAAAEAGELRRTEVGVFASRGLYGRYLASLLAEAVSGAAGPARVLPVPGQAVDLVPEGDGYRLDLADGTTLDVAGAVLAVGNLPTPGRESPAYKPNPWAPGAVEGLRPDLPVLVRGTGLTTLDLALEMRARGFPGPVVAISRRGLLPQRHDAPAPGAPPGALPWPMPNFTQAERGSLVALLRRLRAEVAAAQAAGADWRAVLDAIRPVTAELWRGLPEGERARFLRHLRPFWESHRHRMAPPVAEAVREMLRTGYLQVHRGRIMDIALRPDGAIVTWRRRGAATPERLRVQRVINATGVEVASRADEPLVRSLLARGLARLDPSGLGVEVTDTLQVLGAEGRVVPNLWALGPIVRGVFWECTAVPDIRVQAEQVAEAAARALARAERLPA